jgi:hypothetical protein
MLVERVSLGKLDFARVSNRWSSCGKKTKRRTQLRRAQSGQAVGKVLVEVA